ncbi:MAG: hypothetical protein ACLQBD_19710 [Syntrophobacteraceae bacterium]
MWTLDTILNLLSRYSQRATYGAVGGVLGVPARFVMLGRPRNPRNSWVVNKRTLYPTGYGTAQLAPGLYKQSTVLKASDELLDWLNNRKGTL